MFRLICLLVAIAVIRCEDVDVVTPSGDSYLDAFKDSKNLNADTNISDREYNLDQGGYPDSGYSPDFQYGPPRPVYGPPAYHNHGPTGPYYGPPAPFYGMPHAMLGILDKLKFKLDLFTIGKILLKLVIFKKIVSLIAIVCLLLFIPSFKHIKGYAGDDEYRNMGISKLVADERINRISTFLFEAINKYSNDQMDAHCDSTFCRSQKLLKSIDQSFSYDTLTDNYINNI